MLHILTIIIHISQYLNVQSESEWALLARYVYTYEEFAIVTEAPQCNRMTVTRQDTDNKRIIYKYTIEAMYKMAKTQYIIQTIMCEVWRANLKWKNKYVWWINNCVFQCSWDGLLGERNCFCVWSFWCSELWSVDQTVTIKRVSVLDVRGPQWFCQPFCSLWISTVLGEWGGLYQWFARQTGLPSVIFWGQIW